MTYIEVYLNVFKAEHAHNFVLRRLFLVTYFLFRKRWHHSRQSSGKRSWASRVR